MAGTAAGAAAARARREAQLAALKAQLAEEAADVRVVAAGVDTLELHTSQPLAPRAVERLEALKVAAQQTPPGERLPSWGAAGHVFEVRRTGSKRGSLLLDVADVMAVSLNPHAPQGLPTAMVEVRSRHLWQDLDAAAAEAEEVLGVLTLGEHPEMQVSRVDVTADWQGWEPSASLLEAFVTRARRDATYRHHRKHTGWAWGGGGAVLARVYDKTAEIRGTPKEAWFPAVWRRSGHYDSDFSVWRVEYQVRREAIRELAPLGLGPGTFKAWETCRPHLGSIFSTLSDAWCALRLPRAADTRRELDPRWQAVRGQARFDGCEAPQALERLQAEAEFSRTLDQLAAYAARGIAERWALHGRSDDARTSYGRLWDELQAHLGRKGESLEGRAEELYEPLQTQAAAAELRRARRRRAA